MNNNINNLQKPSDKYIQYSPYIKDDKFTKDYKTGEGFWNTGNIMRSVKWFVGIDEEARQGKYIKYLSNNQAEAPLSKEAIVQTVYGLDFNKNDIQSYMEDLWECAQVLTVHNASKDPSNLKVIKESDLKNSFDEVYKYSLQYLTIKIDNECLSIDEFNNLKNAAIKNKMNYNDISSLTFLVDEHISYLSRDGRIGLLMYFVENNFSEKQAQKFILESASIILDVYGYQGLNQMENKCNFPTFIYMLSTAIDELENQRIEKSISEFELIDEADLEDFKRVKDDQL